MELRVSHAGAIAEDVQHAFGRLGARGMGTERVNNGLQLSIIEFGTARGRPLFGVGAGSPEDRLSGAVESLFDVEPVQDLNGLWKQLRSGVPDPGRAIAQHRASGSLSDTSARCFTQHTFGEVGSFEAGVRSGGAFDAGRIGDRSRVPHRLTLLIPRFGSPHSDDLGLAGFG